MVGWLKRHITPKECARIQDFDVDGIHGKPFKLGDSDQQSYKQLGNAVNVNLIYLIQSNIDTYLGWREKMEMNKIKEIAGKIEQWDWNQFFSHCEKLGGQLDGLDWRVVKGIWTNEALMRSSRGEFQPKENQIGFDGKVGFMKIETKGEKKGLFPKTTGRTKWIQLKNTHEKKKENPVLGEQFQKTFDYLLLFQTTPPYKVAGTSWFFANKHKGTVTEGQVNTRIPYENLHFIDVESGQLNDNSPRQTKPILQELKKVINDWFDKSQ